MASIVRMSKGRQPRRAIEFRNAEGRKCRVHIGKVSIGDANDFKRGIEKLLMARKLNRPLDDITVQWVSGLSEPVQAKLSRFGLLECSNAVPDLERLIDAYLARKRVDVKPKSFKRIEDTMQLVRKHVLTTLPADKVNYAIAQDFQAMLRKSGIADGTVRLHIRNCKTLYNDAIKREILAKNPFKDLASTSVAAAKDRYITPEETTRLLDAAPNWKWRLLIGLLRYAGLRCHSETHAVNWSDVDWVRRTLSVNGVKTGKFRAVPIRPELMELMQDAYEMATPNASSMIELPTNNRHRELLRIIKKSGMERWADLFQHLRRCCRTQWLNENHPPHAVSRWMGHGQQVGDDHYTMMTDDVFDRATGKSVAESVALNHGSYRQLPAAEKTAELAAQEKLSLIHI